MPETRRTVTVDGSAASGKTALARLLAEALGFQHLNSGLLYRGVGWLTLHHGISPNDEPSVVEVVRQNPLSLVVGSTGGCELFISDAPCRADLTASTVSAAASEIAQLPKVRALLVGPQKDAFPGSGIVAEGRDMGTIIFPDAVVKFFVDARIEVRAARRCAQLIARGELVTEESVARELRDRDLRDSSRVYGPMKRSEDAIVIDNSDRSLNESVAAMVSEVHRTIGSP